MSLEKIAQELKDAYTFIVAPVAMMDVPVSLKNLLKEDGSYYSMNELSSLLGRLFQPVASIDERFIKFRWSIPMNGEEALIIEYMKSMGLVDMRDNNLADSLNHTVEEIDFTDLNGNEFGIFAMSEIKRVPDFVVEDGFDE